MTAKRALVVDDSKSSRMFLTKLLAEQALEVDAAETAEAAIDYLSRSRPDVIFMDHLMPGMDGFQAMQAIKSNPLTAQIPILMYTSQEGELYHGQARALGAAGVLSKGASGADVHAVLRDLWPAPLTESDIVITPPADVVAPAPAAPMDISSSISVTAAPMVPALQLEQVREEFTLLRQQFAAALEAQRLRAADETRQLLQDARAAAEAPLAAVPERPRHSPVPWLLALAAGVAAAVFGTLQWQSGEQLKALRAELADSKAAVALLTARLTLPPEVEEPAAATDADAAPATTAPAVAPVSPASAANTLAATVVPSAAASAPSPVAVPVANHTPE